jgi:hypothetical protein
MIIVTSVILLITLIVTVLFFKRWIGFCRVALEDVAEALGTEQVLNVWNVSASVTGRVHGRPVSVRFANQTRSSPPTVTVIIPVNSGIAFTARKPNFFDRWCIAMGLASPITTGDFSFDGAIYVDTGDRERLNAALSDNRFREALRGLFQEDVMRITCHKRRLSLVRKLPPRKAVPPTLVFNILPGLWRVAECMTPITDSSMLWVADKNRIMMRWGLAPGLSLMAGVTLLITGMTLYEPLFSALSAVLFWALPWSISAAVVYGFLVWLLVRLRTDRHILIMAVLALALPGCCLGVMGWRIFGNGWLDEGTPAQYEATVWETLNKGRGGRRIVFMVDGKESAEFSSHGGRYPRGLPVQLTVYPGHYRIPWLDRWEILKKGETR